MLYTFYLAAKGRYILHKNLQTLLLLFTTIAVIALELDLKFGHIKEISTLSPFYSSDTLKYLFIIHLLFSISTFFIWVWLVLKSSLIYPKPFVDFNHKLWGKILFVDLSLTVLTGWALYIMLFAL
jgi:hypothetical protein